jgi:exosortase/archaeosortase family protein
MQKTIKNALRNITGISLIILGVLGLFLPFLQGILLIALGILVLKGHKINLRTLKIKNKELIFLPIRYLILLGLMFTLPIIYKILTPLTVTSTAGILRLFYQLTINQNIMTINSTIIQIIPACVAGSAYLLLLILNLSTPIKAQQRTLSLLFSLGLLFTLNILRIIILTILAVQNSQLFDITHKLFWYLLSTIFVIGIWFLTTKLFDIKQIPVYSDIKFLVGNIIKQTNAAHSH